MTKKVSLNLKLSKRVGLASTRSFLRGLFPACCLGLLVSISGCSPQAQVVSPEIIAAESISDGPSTWTQKTWSEAEERKLAAYFLRNQSLAENPSFGGQKFIYEDSQGNTRYYWATAIGEQCQWIMLEFVGGRAKEMTEGSGGPFSIQSSAANGG